MSYYSSKHPGLYLYIALVIASISSFLYADMSSAQIGVLAILWGGFTSLRALSLYEVSEHYSAYAQNIAVSKNHNAQISSLAHDLIQRMGSSSNLKGGIKALNCLNDRTILWFTLALAYSAYSLHLSASTISKIDMMETMCTMFMIGATFWGGQSYAYSNKASRLLVPIFSISFLISLYSLPLNISYTTLFQAIQNASIFEGGSPHTILVLLILYSIAILLYALIQRNKTTLSVVTGILLVVVISFYHLATEPSHTSIALWISGWGMFSIFWIKAYNPVQKRYVIYQCV